MIESAGRKVSRNARFADCGGSPGLTGGHRGGYGLNWPKSGGRKGISVNGTA